VLRVSHFAHADAGSGASANALRVHLGVGALGACSRLWVVHKYSAAADVMQLRRASFVGRRWRELEPQLEARLLSMLAPASEQPLSSGMLGFDPLAIVEADEPDIVQLHWLGCATLRIDRLPLIKRPIVWRLADMWAFCGVEHLCEDPRRFLSDEREDAAAAPVVDRLIARNKQRIYDRIEDLTIVCASRWMADLTRRSRLLRDRPVELIPTGCDTNVYRPLDRRVCRDLLRLPQDRPLVLAGATNLSARHKGFDLFVSAMNVLYDAGQRDAAVVLFGPHSGGVTRALRSTVFELGPLADPLHVALVYNACDAFVAPSRIENLANTVLESMACGTPCVAFSIGGMPDMITHRETGFLATAFAVDELSAGVRWAIEHPEPQALRVRCRATIEARFTLETQAAGFMSLYERLAG
jgi:glycosyltransferase involved in cell wall biosynthesis